MHTMLPWFSPYKNCSITTSLGRPHCHLAKCIFSGFGKQSEPLEDDHLLQLCRGPAGGRARVPGAVGLPLPVPVAPCRRLSSLWHHPGEDHSYRDSIMRFCRAVGAAGGRAADPRSHCQFPAQASPRKPQFLMGQCHEIFQRWALNVKGGQWDEIYFRVEFRIFSYAEILPIPASVGTVESEGRQMIQCWIKYEEKAQKIPQKK